MSCASGGVPAALLVFAWTISASLDATALSITTAAGNGADGHVFRNQPNDTFDTEDILIKFDSDTGGFDRKGYLRFDLSSLTAPVSNALLQLTFIAQGSNGVAVPSYNVYGLNDGAAESWDERFLNWNNAPANNNTGNSVDTSQATLLGSFSFDATIAAPGDVVSFTSAALVTFLAADANGSVTLIVVATQPALGGEIFADKESSSFAAPALIVPEPAMSPLVGVALLTGLYARRPKYRVRHR